MQKGLEVLRSSDQDNVPSDLRGAKDDLRAQTKGKVLEISTNGVNSGNFTIQIP